MSRVNLRTKIMRRNWWVRKLLRRMSHFMCNSGEYIMDKDWDNLIILDACRYDAIVELLGFECDYAISRGSSTREFFEENFVDRKYNDIVYVADNPYPSRLCKHSFYKLVSVWNDSNHRPEYVFSVALDMARKFPNKRLIVHFLQPHFLPKDMNVVDSELKVPDWEEVRKGEISINRVYEAYKRNLKLVLYPALVLAKQLRGRTVITADHGEAMGDEFHPLIPIRIYGHPAYIRDLTLTKVPWIVFDNSREEFLNKEKYDKVIEKLKEKSL